MEKLRNLETEGANISTMIMAENRFHQIVVRAAPPDRLFEHPQTLARQPREFALRFKLSIKGLLRGTA